MIISLPNGKSIEVSLEAYLRMTDDDFNNLMALNSGEDFNSPFAFSVLLYGEERLREEIDEDSIADELADPSDLDKLEDLDIEKFDE